jgi:prevent-host-death family protein
MTTISATKARSQLYQLIDAANHSHEPIQITGKRGNAVLLSESDWSAYEKLTGNLKGCISRRISFNTLF